MVRHAVWLRSVDVVLGSDEALHFPPILSASLPSSRLVVGLQGAHDAEADGQEEEGVEETEEDHESEHLGDAQFWLLSMWLCCFQRSDIFFAIATISGISGKYPVNLSRTHRGKCDEKVAVAHVRQREGQKRREAALMKKKGPVFGVNLRSFINPRRTVKHRRSHRRQRVLRLA